MKTPMKDLTSAKLQPPSFTDVAAWSAIVGSSGLATYRDEGILLAYDHFRRLAIVEGVRSPNYALAQNLIAHLTNLMIHQICFSIRNRSVTTGEASAYKTACVLAIAAMTDVKSDRWQRIRTTFSLAVTYCAWDALRLEFDRKNSAWAGARFVGTDNETHGLDQTAPLRNGQAITTPVVTGSLEDSADRSDLKAALMRTLRAEPDHDIRLMAIWIYQGYSAESLAPIFGISAPTIRARVQTLALSKHLGGY